MNPKVTINITKPVEVVDNNPNPFKYKIEKVLEHGGYLLLLINYPDCTNYEGNKILLFKDCTLAALEKQSGIDPHFSSDIRYHSPIARFEPTSFGWMMGVNMMEVLRSRN